MKTKIISLKKIITKEMALLIGLFFLSFFSPLIGMQAISGPLVNAALFLATFFLGIKNALWFAFFPSLIALFSGIISPVMTPMIPFIISSNIILITLFYYFKEKFWMGVVLASFCKFIFLFLSTLVLGKLMFSGEIALKVSSIFGWHQLLTAILGGFIAYLIVLFINNYRNSSK